MALVPSDIPKLLTAGLREEFMTTYEKVTTDYERISTVIQSNKATETFAWLGSVPKMREWKGERIPKGLLEKTYTISSRDWESSLAIDRNALEDELYGQIRLRVRELASEAKRFFDEFVFNFLEQGALTKGAAGSYFEGKDVTCYDGKAFFATDHSEGLSGTQSNRGSAALSYTSLKAAITAMQKFKNDQGKVMGIRPTLLVVPADLEFTAREILQSEYYPHIPGQTADETKPGYLARNVLRGVLDLLVTPYLTDTNNWYLFDTTRQLKPIIFVMRKAPEFVALDQGTESWFMRKQIYYGVDFRGNVGWGLWQTAYGGIVS